MIVIARSVRDDRRAPLGARARAAASSRAASESAHRDASGAMISQNHRRRHRHRPRDRRVTMALRWSDPMEAGGRRAARTLAYSLGGIARWDLQARDRRKAEKWCRAARTRWVLNFGAGRSRELEARLGRGEHNDATAAKANSNQK